MKGKRYLFIVFKRAQVRSGREWKKDDFFQVILLCCPRCVSFWFPLVGLQRREDSNWTAEANIEVSMLDSGKRRSEADPAVSCL